MESFIDFIFSNLFILIIIFAFIMNMMNRAKKNSSKKQTERMPPQKTEKKNPLEDMFEEFNPLEEIFGKTKQTEHKEAKEILENEPVLHEKQEGISSSFEQERQAQYERLRSQIQVSSTSVEDVKEFVSNTTREEREQQVEKAKSATTISLHKNLTQQGLMESIIMAEVLGPPRAHKPYRFHTRKPVR